MRTELAQITDNMIPLRKLNIDVDDITHIVTDFDNLCIMRNEDRDINKLIEAKTRFETGLTLLKSLIEPRENRFISGINEKYDSHDVLVSYLDNLITILDSEQTKMIDSLKLVRDRLIFDSLQNIFNKSFKEKMHDYVYNLIVIPLLKASTKYIFAQDLFKEEKDKKEIFEYILFREVFIASKIKGSKTRKDSSISGMGSNFHETNIIKPGRTRSIHQAQFTAQTPPDVPGQEFNDFLKDEDFNIEDDNVDKE